SPRNLPVLPVFLCKFSEKIRRDQPDRCSRHTDASPRGACLRRKGARGRTRSPPPPSSSFPLAPPPLQRSPCLHASPSPPRRPPPRRLAPPAPPPPPTAALPGAPPASAYCRSSVCPVDGSTQHGQVCEPPAADDCGTVLQWRQPCISFGVQKDASHQIPLDKT